MSAAQKKPVKKPVSKSKQVAPSTKGVIAVKTAAPAGMKHPKPGLGRGLDALIGGDASTARRGVQASVPPSSGVPVVKPVPTDRQAVLLVPVAEIERSPWQPRQTFDEESLHELAESIKANGIIQPLICRKNAAGRFELIAGERRLRASQVAGLTRVPVVLHDAPDRKAAEMAVVENIQRCDLNVIEEAEGYRLLADTFNVTQAEIAERVGKARATVTNALRLLDLPDEVKQLLGGNLLSTGHAKVLLGLTDATEQTVLGRKCVTEKLSVRALERVIARRRGTPTDTVRMSSKPDLPDTYVRDLTDRLYKHFGTAVRVMSGATHANGKHTKGVMEIDFYDNDDLDRILEVLGVVVE